MDCLVNDMEYRLGDLYEVSNGLSKSGEFFGTGYPFLTFSTVFNNYFIPNEIKDYVQSTAKEQKSYSIKAGDVFITRTSETTDELGMSCVALKDYPTATYNGFCKRLRPITENTNPLYMGYYFRSEVFRANFKKVASLITRASLRNEDLMRFKVDLPSLETQTKISEMLYKYDSLIENNNKRIKVLEQMAENLYKEWFVRFRFPGYETAEFENGVPVGWKKGKIKEFITFLNGFAFSSDDYTDNGEYGIITIKNVQDGVFADGNVEHIAEIPSRMPDYCRLKIGDTLISLTGNVGRVCMVSGDNFLLNQRVAKIESKYPYYTYNFFRQESIYLSLCNIAYGTAQLNLSPILASNLKVIIPDEKVVKQYNDLVKPTYEFIQKIITENKNLTKQRDMLLPRLMSGKLEV